MYEQIRDQLNARRAEILKRKSEVVADLIDDVPDRKGDTIDISNDEQTESTQLAIESRYARELAGIDAALLRMAADTYGECDICGDDIPRRRLQSQPLASTCVECQEAVETEAERRYKRPGLMDEYQ